MDLKYILIGLIVIIVVVSSLALYSYSESSKSVPPVSKSDRVEIKVKNRVMQVEIARTPSELSRGLMNRESLPGDSGMLFVFPDNGVHPFWMKNTLIPLDMVWINSTGEVVYIYENARPCSNIVQAVCESIIPPVISKYVLEVNAGKVSELDLKVGDKIDLEKL